MAGSTLKMKVLFSLLAFVFMLYLFFDYFNLPSIMGLSISNINMVVFDIVASAFVIILLFMITYYTVDKKRLHREENAKQTANVLMVSTYKKCRDTLCLLSNKEILTKYIVPSINFDEIELNEPVLQHLKKQPFSENEQIVQLAESGFIPKEDLKTYLSIMEQFGHLVFMEIALFDIDVAITKEQKELRDTIKNKHQVLVKELNTEIEAKE